MIKYLKTSAEFNKGFITKEEADVLQFNIVSSDTEQYVKIEGEGNDINSWISKVSGIEISPNDYNVFKANKMIKNLQTRKIQLEQELAEVNSQLGV